MVGFLRISISNLFSFLIMSKSKKQNMETNVFCCSFEFQVHYSWCLIYNLRLPYYGWWAEHKNVINISTVVWYFIVFQYMFHTQLTMVLQKNFSNNAWYVPTHCNSFFGCVNLLENRKRFWLNIVYKNVTILCINLGVILFYPDIELVMRKVSLICIIAHLWYTQPLIYVSLFHISLNMTEKRPKHVGGLQHVCISFYLIIVSCWYIKGHYLSTWNIFFGRGSPIVDLVLILIYENFCGFEITHDTPQSVGFLWTSNQLVAETPTWQHITHRHPCPGGIRTQDIIRRTTEDLRLRSRGHWDRQYTEHE